MKKFSESKLMISTSIIANFKTIYEMIVLIFTNDYSPFLITIDMYFIDVIIKTALAILVARYIIKFQKQKVINQVINEISYYRLTYLFLIINSNNVDSKSKDKDVYIFEEQKKIREFIKTNFKLNDYDTEKILVDLYHKLN